MNSIFADSPEDLTPRAEAVHDGLSVASLILSLLGLFLLPGVGALLAVVFGHMSHSAARRAGRRNSGLATAGLVLGYLGLATFAIVLTVVIAGLSSHPATAPAPILPTGTDIWSACHTSDPPPYCG